MTVFEGNFDISRILAELEILLNKRILPGRDLLFLDEIQSCPRAITALRYFHEEMPQLHVVAAGSLLEFALEDISLPVGRIQFLEMHPLSFQEYLNALDKRPMAQALTKHPSLLSHTIHQALLRELRDYMLIGGMPEAVAAYVETRSIEEALRVHEELIEIYRQDFSKVVCVKFCKKESGMLRNVGKLFGRHRESAYVAGRRCRCEQLPGKVHAAWLLRLIVSLRCSFKVSMLR